MATVSDLRVANRKTWEKMRDMLSLAEKDSRKFSAAEESRYASLERELDAGRSEVADAEGQRDEKLDRFVGALDKRGALDNFEKEFSKKLSGRVDLGEQPEARTIRDERTGLQYRAHKPEAKMHDGKTDALSSLARIVRAKISADYAADLDREERVSYVGTDASGGWLVPQVMSSQLIAASRDACPVASRCNTLVFDKLNQTLVGIDVDPVASVQLEGQAMSEGSVTFHKITLSPHRIGTYITLSKELAQASNAVEEISDALRYAVARALDSAILGYQTSGGIAGVANSTGINTYALGGATLSLDNVVTYFHQLKSAGAPEGISMFYNSDQAEAFSTRKDGEGRYVLSGSPGGLPDIWSRINRYETNIIPTASNQTDIFMGNFRFGYLGLQSNWEILVSEVAYDSSSNAFTQGLVKIRIMGWADFGLGHSDYFTYVSGASV
jgi:HK97 family phage major capsid protein